MILYETRELKKFIRVAVIWRSAFWTIISVWVIEVLRVAVLLAVHR